MKGSSVLHIILNLTISTPNLVIRILLKLKIYNNQSWILLSDISPTNMNHEQRTSGYQWPTVPHHQQVSNSYCPE